MDFKTMTIEQLEARSAEIVKSLDTMTEIPDELLEEARGIKAELESRKAAEKRSEEIRKALAGGAGEQVRSFGKKEGKSFGIDSEEYRSAWLKNLMGAPLTETEKRAYASTDANNAIPTITQDKMFEKMVKIAPILSRITLLRVKGFVKFVAQGTRNAATTHTENSVMTAAADTVVTVTLGAVEFIKIIQLSAATEVMSVNAFEDWLTKMLADDIAHQLDNYIINGGSNGLADLTFTTGTNQILNTETTGYTYANICNLIALLPAGYDANAAFLVHKSTLWGKIATITNSSGTPIFVPDVKEGVAGRLMGYPVIEDDYVTTANGALYLGDYSQIVGNMSQDSRVDMDKSAGFMSNSTMYRGTAIFDSAVANSEAFVRLVTTA